MRIMKYIFIHPKVGLWSESKNQRIRDEERSLGFFLGSYLQKYKLSYEKFDGVLFEGTSNIEEHISIQNKLLIVPIIMLENGYPNEKNIVLINEYLVSHLHIGLEKIAFNYKELADLIIQGIEEFKKNDYVCTWTHKKKKISKNSIELHCTLTVDCFRLSLFILDARLEVVFSKNILETPPNEYSFKHRFKDIIISNNVLYITDYSNEKWFELDISNLCK